MSIAKLFGILQNGKEVHEYTLTNGKALTVAFISYGAAIRSLWVTGKDGTKTDVVLGFDTLEGYTESYSLPSPPYFGAVIGRYAGRIANGIFSIGGRDYVLAKNHGDNTLHGGRSGFGRAVWEVKEVVQESDSASITFAYTSPDGEEFFPGELQTEITYTLTPGNEIMIDYAAKSSEDTVVNLTQHSYFNLEGHNSGISAHQLMVNSVVLLGVAEDGIPTGHYIEAREKGFDFKTPSVCPVKIDTSFVLGANAQPAAILSSVVSGLKMTVYTDQPSVHIYVGGNCFGKIAGKEGVAYHPQSGICFETQNYPDAPNKPHFPNAILRKGETYTHKTMWKFEQL